jgi:hypothetical protein
MLAKFEKLPRTESVDWIGEIINTQYTVNFECRTLQNNVQFEA